MLLGVLLWVGLASGLLVQVFAPRLKIQNSQFVIPPALIESGNEVRPDEIVARERRMQLLSGILTLGGALGLAVYYRHALVGSRLPKITSEGKRDENA